MPALNAATSALSPLASTTCAKSSALRSSSANTTCSCAPVACASVIAWSSAVPAVREPSVPTTMTSYLTIGLRPQHAAGPEFGGIGDDLAVLPNDRAVDEHVSHTLGLVGDKTFAVGGKVADAAERTRRDGLLVEYDDVGGQAWVEPAAIAQTEHGRGFTCELVDRALERHHGLVANPVAEQVGREARVAQLTHVRARIGEAEQHSVLGEELRDRVGVIVREDTPEPRLEVLLQGEVEHDVERRVGPFRRDVGDLRIDELRMFRRFGHHQRLEVDRQGAAPARELIPRARTPLGI